MHNMLHFTFKQYFHDNDVFSLSHVPILLLYIDTNQGTTSCTSVCKILKVYIYTRIPYILYHKNQNICVNLNWCKQNSPSSSLLYHALSPPRTPSKPHPYSIMKVQSNRLPPCLQQTPAQSLYNRKRVTSNHLFVSFFPKNLIIRTL